jgi:DNA-binding response OmpR family regulator
MNSVLIVEDDEDLRRELSDYLTSAGYAVHGVGNQAAAEQVLHQGFDVFLLDINLPDGNAIDFCTRVRPYVRGGIVMMTGRSERALRLQGLRSGADAYLVKPVDPEELEAVLHSVLRRVGERRFTLLQAAPMPVQWRVELVRRTLSVPNGRSCNLSKGETLMLMTLLRAEGQQASRDELLTAFEAQGIASGGHRVEALISRLRSKVMADMALELPIQSVYGQGYAFVDHALLV